MLAKILEDMWVEPAVLEALSEDQKRILFLKMREEQVRRWRVREEREAREAQDNKEVRPKKGRVEPRLIIAYGFMVLINRKHNTHTHTSVCSGAAWAEFPVKHNNVQAKHDILITKSIINCHRLSHD